MIATMAPKKKTPWRKRLKALRSRLGLTQALAAKRVGVGQGVWAAWENGLRTPSRQSQLLIDLLDNS